MKPGKRFAYISLTVAAVINALIWASVFWLIPRTTAVIILHYNIYLGPDSFGQWYKVLWLPGVGLGVMVINAVLARWFQREASFLNTMLCVATVAVQVCLAVALVFILLVNRFI